jgi:hypothetical protein
MVEQKTKSKRKINMGAIGWITSALLAGYILLSSGIVNISTTNSSICVEVQNGN